MTRHRPRIVMKLILLFFLLGSTAVVAQSDQPVHIIFDTDIGPDYDDVGAITMLHALADSGQVKILATVASSKYPEVGAVLNVFNTYFGRPDLPLGVPKGNAVALGAVQKWPETIVARYPHKVKSNDETPDPVTIYRQILSKQADHSVTVVTVGFLTNLANLLHSKPDSFSPLDGTALVKKKVKILVSMAGIFPNGKEFNVEKDVAASQFVFQSWPTSIILSGFEIGKKILTGLPLIHNDKIQNSPAKDVFSLCIPMSPEDKDGRKSWDQTAVLVAVKGYAPYYMLEEGRIIVAENGSNSWDSGGKGHFHLKEKMPVEEVSLYINRLMMHQPRLKK